METYEPVNSSNIKKIEFDHGAGEMTVYFHSGGVYRHFGVPHDTFLGIQNSASAGSYYHRNIKDRFGYERIGS